MAADQNVWRDWRENVARACLDRALSLLREWLPEGRQEGSHFRAGSLSGEKGRSLTVSIVEGLWKDFGTNQGGKNLVSLYAKKRGIEYRAANDELAERFNIAKPRLQRVNRWVPIAPVPFDAPYEAFKDESPGLPRLEFEWPGEVVGIWTYLDNEGRILYHRVRLETFSGKQFRPVTFCRHQDTGEHKWQLQDLKPPRPLYGAHLLPSFPDAPVLIVEGEKTADAAEKLLGSAGWIVITFGAAAVSAKNTGWSPLLLHKGRKVGWPDNDKPGRHAINEVADILQGQLEIVQTDPSWRETWDLADALAEGWDTTRVLDYLEHHVVEAQPTDKISLPANDPYQIADNFIASAAGANFYNWQEEWFHWDGIRYRRMSDSDYRALLARWFRRHVRLTRKREEGGESRVELNTTHMNWTIDALCNMRNLPAPTKMPCWLGVEPMGDLVAVQNGILNVASLSLQPASPDLFTLYALQTEFNPDAICPQWESFLRDLWPTDDESVEVLQEIFGYLLLPQTHHQKAFMIVGPKRSGKGTISRVITRLLGIDQVASPALGAFGAEFGLADIIGKSLITISDARLDASVSGGLLAENILRITGEDQINIPRKYLADWSGRLHTRFLLLANELPRFHDASSALPYRFIILRTVRDFSGHEDLRLEGKLATELAGILNWSLDGWRRLQQRGHFIQPTDAKDAVEELAQMANPLGKFLDEACDLGKDYETSVNELYGFYLDWAKRFDEGVRVPSVNLFGRDLRAAMPSLTIFKPHGEPRRYRGIRPRWSVLRNENGRDETPF